MKEVNNDLRTLPDGDRVDGADVVCDLPNNNLEHFEGTWTLANEHKIPLTARNLLLRGCMLRNTEWALGAVVYTGRETKIQMNAVEATSKTGSIKRFVDRMTIWVFCLQMLCCLIGSVVGAINMSLPQGKGWYIFPPPTKPLHSAYQGFLLFFTYTLVFTNFVPISLLGTWLGR